MHEKKLKGDLKKKHRFNCVIILDPSILVKKKFKYIYREKSYRRGVFPVSSQKNLPKA
jgi:hypothetical protein